MKESTATVQAPVQGGTFRWMSALTLGERRVFTACVGGWALDAMNVQLYSFVIPALIATWGLTRSQAGALGTAALLVSAAGGWLPGWFADRYAPVPTLPIAILWFAVVTFFSRLPQYYQPVFSHRARLVFASLLR